LFTKLITLANSFASKFSSVILTSSSDSLIKANNIVVIYEQDFLASQVNLNNSSK